MIKRIFSLVQNIKIQHEDSRIGRNLVGIDQNGNRYYQYLDQKGNETKREFVNNKQNEKVDPLWEDWLRNKSKNPHTEDELNQIHAKQRRFQSAIDGYETRDAEMMYKHHLQQKSTIKQAEKPFNLNEFDRSNIKDI